MIAFVRTVCVRPGKQMEAMSFAREIAAYFKGTYEMDMEVLRPVGGNPHRISWSTRYADLAALDAFSTKMLGDQKYWQLVNGAADCFIAGATRDSIWQTV
jgi:hypothetical protein